MNNTLLLFLLLITYLPVSAQDTIKVPLHSFGVDERMDIVVSRAPLAELNAANDGVFTTFIADERVFSFVTPPAELSYGTSYLVSSFSIRYQLYFTELPLVRVTHTSTIRNEPKIAATLSYADDEQILTSPIGIELRGNSSLNFPKKTYDLEFRQNDSIESRDVQFGNMREDDDWILDGLYNEPQRVNAFMAHKLWLDMHAPYYLDQDDRARAGADVMLVEMFLKGSYNGVYLLSEQIDRKLLRLKKQREDGEIRGLMYKGVGHGDGIDLIGLPDPPEPAAVRWDGYEPFFPKREDTVRWDPALKFIDFVVNSDDPTFAADYPAYFREDNLIDYFIYLNVIGGEDNRGKNIYLARQDTDEPFFYVPWDLDGTFSNRWNGQNNPDTISFVYTNGLMNRLFELNPNGYRDRLCDRYRELNVKGLLSEAAIQDRYADAMSYLDSNGVYERESLRHGSTLDLTEARVGFATEWISDRMIFLDSFFCQQANEIIISVSDEEADLNPLRIVPNPARNVATVSHPHLQRGKFDILDLNGRTVRNGELGRASTTLDLNGLRAGIYFLRAGRRVTRFIVR